MKTVFNYIIDDWKRVKNHCRTTVGKEFTENEPTEEFKKTFGELCKTKYNKSCFAR